MHACYIYAAVLQTDRERSSSRYGRPWRCTYFCREVNAGTERRTIQWGNYLHFSRSDHPEARIDAMPATPLSRLPPRVELEVS
jgi:hypothetical protein